MPTTTRMTRSARPDAGAEYQHPDQGGIATDTVYGVEHNLVYSHRARVAWNEREYGI
ncbi:MAG: hypothetical protein H7A08_04870 [Oceanospirillaceae bacterium]|nr:hypothetical protein [Oceanospirillaceae bacterium]